MVAVAPHNSQLMDIPPAPIKKLRLGDNKPSVEPPPPTLRIETRVSIYRKCDNMLLVAVLKKFGLF